MYIHTASREGYVEINNFICRNKSKLFIHRKMEIKFFIHRKLEIKVVHPWTNGNQSCSSTEKWKLKLFIHIKKEIKVVHSW